MRTSNLTLALALLAFCAAPVAAQESPTLKKIKDSGTITIGHRDSSIPFSYYDDKQNVVGYALDICMKVVDAIKAELKMPNLQVKLNPGDVGDADPADRERHDRPRMRLDDEQPRAAEAGRLHEHLLPDGQPVRLEEGEQPQVVDRPEGQDGRLDVGHDEPQADHRDERCAEPGHEHPDGEGPRRGVPDGRDRPRERVLHGRHPALQPGRQLEGAGRLRDLGRCAVRRAVRRDDAQGRSGVQEGRRHRDRQPLQERRRSPPSTTSGSCRRSRRRAST